MLRVLLALAALIAVCVVPTASATPGSKLPQEVRSRFGVVATESPAAARVGRAVLEAGGNAVDAAAATVFAMGVARPQSCGIGGGGFMLFRARNGAVRALDFRETAPARMRPTTLAETKLPADFTGALTVGVPGTIAGMEAALARFGTISLAEAMAPGERLARTGFRVPTSLTGAMRQNAARLGLFPESAGQFLKPDGSAYGPGETLTQPDLAATYRRIMRGGARAFYRGATTRRILRDLRRPAAGDPTLLTQSDFANYRALWRAPLRGSFRGHTVHAFPPPTSGGVALLQLLGILEPLDLRSLGATSAQAIHYVAEAQKLVFADRARYLADPAFVRQPVAGLLDPSYLQSRRFQIDPDRAKSFGPGEPPGAGTTTHISVIDRAGNSVALTCTIEQEFGSAIVARDTGVLLNNELTDFGTAGTANEAAGGKRPRSSMSPTIVEIGGRPVMVLGGAGGARIIMGVAETLLRHVEFGESLARAVDGERFDNGGGSRLVIEDARLPAETLAGLEQRGHPLTREGEYGVRPRVQLAGIDSLSGDRVAVSDSRSDRGSLAVRGNIAVAVPSG